MTTEIMTNETCELCSPHPAPDAGRCQSCEGIVILPAVNARQTDTNVPRWPGSPPDVNRAG